MARARSPFLLVTPFLAALALAGCDPKLTGAGGDPVDQDGDGDGGGPLEVSIEARLAAAVTMLHVDLITRSLGVAGDFDGSVPAPPIRSFLTEGCIALATLDATTPVHELAVTGCTDPNGSAYFGKAELSPVTGADAYNLLPYASSEDILASSNTATPELNQSWHSGSIQFEFVRDGSNAVTSVNVTNFMRHFMRDAVVTFTFVGMSYAGSPGSLATWPANGSISRIGWDGVGVFDITFSGGASASFREGGIDYQLDLTSGTLTAVQL
jgi:hypothetical protein